MHIHSTVYYLSQSILRALSYTSQEQHDAFCWYCHKGQTEKNCDSCVRTFHHECVTTNDEQMDSNDDGWTCSVCTELKESEKQQK